MPRATPKQGLEQNGMVGDGYLSGAQNDTNPEEAQIIEETPSPSDLHSHGAGTPSPAETGPGDTSTQPDEWALQTELDPRPTLAAELDQLRSENTDLLRKVVGLEELLEEKLRAEQSWAEQQKNQEALLEEKSEVIRELHLKLQEARSPATTLHEPGATPREPGVTPREEELLALSEELEQERRQLKEDEEALMMQMRQMEVQMSRERAELARQRNDLQRLHSEIHHELELASRQSVLRDRLQPLQRRHQEMLHRKGSEPGREAAAPEAANATAPAPQQSRSKDSSGLLRRIFG